MNKLFKAGSILLSQDHTKACLVHREKLNDISFPKGHIEGNESYLDCAIRETEEETGYSCKPLLTDPLGIITYTNYEGEVIVFMYLLEECGLTTKDIPDCDREEPIWLDLQDVENKLSYSNLKTFWNDNKNKIEVL